MEVAASIITVIQISGSITNLCWHYRKVKKASQEADRVIQQLKSLNTILEGLVDLLQKEDGLDDDPRFRAIHTLQASGQLNAFLAVLKELEEKFTLSRGWDKFIFPLKSKELEDAMQEIERFKSTASLSLNVHHAARLQLVDEKVNAVSETQNSTEEAQRMERIMKWLAPPDPDATHYQKLSQHQDKTGEWFLQGDSMDQWRSAAPSLLWLHGIPGCGKSVLSSTVIESLRHDVESKPDEVVAFFYFEFSDSKKRKVESMIRCLIAQLLSKSTVSCPQLNAVFAQHKGFRQPPLFKLLPILKELIGQFATAYIVIDAIDESEMLENTLGVLGEIQQWMMHSLHLFVTSRHLGTIIDAMEGLKPLEVGMNEELVNPDIRTYVCTSVDALRQWDTNTRSVIHDALLAKASGMFRLAFCQLDLIRKCRKLRELYQLLESLPPTLEEIYEQIMMAIPLNERADTIKALEWLAFSERPLRLDALSEALAVEIHDLQGYDPTAKDLIIHRSPLMDSSLVSIVHAPAKLQNQARYHYYDEILQQVPPRTQVAHVQLAHASVRDYLVSDAIKNGSAKCFALNAALVNQSMAQVCLLYILHSNFEAGVFKWDDQEDRLCTWPLHLYASNFWLYHVNELGSDIDEETWNLAQRLFESKGLPSCGNFGAWACSMTPSTTLERVKETTPLYFAASLGADAVVQRLLETTDQSEIDQVGGRRSSSPLQTAVYRGHLRVTLLLLEAGANPNICSFESRGSALFWSTVAGHKDGPAITGILRKHGAEFRAGESRFARKICGDDFERSDVSVGQKEAYFGTHGNMDPD